MPRKNRVNRRQSSKAAPASPDVASSDAARKNSTAGGRRSIVRAAILRECFDALDGAKRGTIVVEEFLERLRSDSKMTDKLQEGTEATREELDAVFDGLERASERLVDVEEFMELFTIDGVEGGSESVKMGVNDVSKAESGGRLEMAASPTAVSSNAASPTAVPSAVKEAPKAEQMAKVEPVAAAAPALTSPMPSASASAVVDTEYLRQVFNLIDYDDNGEITLVEFLSALHSNPEIGALLDEGTATAGDDVSQIVSDVFSRMDADQNKSVNFQEFVKYFAVQQSNAQHALNRLSAEEKKKLLESADKERVRSMSALKRGVRLVSKGVLKAGLRRSKSDLMKENLSNIADEELLVMKSYLQDVFKLVDYEKNKRIVLQEFLVEVAENRNILLSLDVGSNVTGGVEKTKKMIAVVLRAMEIDAKVVVTFPEFANYFIKITSDKFNSHSPLARSSNASSNRSASANAQMQPLVAELFQIEKIALPKEPEPTVEQKKPAPRAPAKPVDELVYGVEENEELDREVHVLREEVQMLMAENQRQKKMNNLLRLKMNALTHMYAVQSVEFQALIDSSHQR